jgi:hypothetical protein
VGVKTGAIPTQAPVMPSRPGSVGWVLDEHPAPPARTPSPANQTTSLMELPTLRASVTTSKYGAVEREASALESGREHNGRVADRSGER